MLYREIVQGLVWTLGVARRGYRAKTNGQGLHCGLVFSFGVQVLRRASVEVFFNPLGSSTIPALAHLLLQLRHFRARDVVLAPRFLQPLDVVLVDRRRLVLTSTRP